MATKLAIIKQIPMSLQEMKKRINAASFNQWREQWNSIPRCLTRFKPEMGEIAYCDIRRRSQVTMTRLRLGTTLTVTTSAMQLQRDAQHAMRLLT